MHGGHLKCRFSADELRTCFKNGGEIAGDGRSIQEGTIENAQGKRDLKEVPGVGVSGTRGKTEIP
jgi:hypothetical protein